MGLPKGLQGDIRRILEKMPDAEERSKFMVGAEQGAGDDVGLAMDIGAICADVNDQAGR